MHRSKVFGAGGQSQTNRSVRVIQTLGSTQRHLRFPAWKGIRPPLRRAFLFYGKKARRASVFVGTAIFVSLRPQPDGWGSVARPTRTSITGPNLALLIQAGDPQPESDVFS